MPKLNGSITLPGDKSIAHRAALFSAIRMGKAFFSNFNLNKDCQATLSCLNALGIKTHLNSKKELIVEGRRLEDWQQPTEVLNAQNSGTTARLLSAFLANLSFPTKLVGDPSLSKRPMKRIIEPLTKMGAHITSNHGFLPLQFTPVKALHGIEYELPVASAQVKSAVLLAGLFAEGQTRVIESVPSRDHTERLLQLPVEITEEGKKVIISHAQLKIPDISMKIPGDFSSAAFFIAGALLLPHSEIVIQNVSLNPTRTGFLQILQQMGAQIEIQQKQSQPEPAGDLVIHSQPLNNIEIPAKLVPNIIDEIPILSILASQSEGTFLLRQAGELRFKESDRIKAIVENLARVGVKAEEFEDGFQINGPQRFRKGRVITHGDHRIAMAFAIANLVSDGLIELDNPACVAVSFPEFFDILKGLIKG